MKKLKCLDLGPKMPYLGILGKIFRKTFVIFQIGTLKFVYLQNFLKKQKFLNFGPKMPDLGILGLEFEKKYCHIWNQHSRIFVNAKFREKKMPKFGIKNALFGYFWARIFKKILSYLKSAPSNLSKMSL